MHSMENLADVKVILEQVPTFEADNQILVIQEDELKKIRFKKIIFGAPWG